MQAEEVFFECRAGRVSYIDLAALTADIRRNTDRMRSELMEQLPGCSGSNEKNNEPEVPAHSDDHWRRGDPGPVER